GPYFKMIGIERISQQARGVVGARASKSGDSLSVIRADKAGYHGHRLCLLKKPAHQLLGGIHLNVGLSKGGICFDELVGGKGFGRNSLMTQGCCKNKGGCPLAYRQNAVFANALFMRSLWVFMCNSFELIKKIDELRAPFIFYR